jgi:hypothetical protein
MKVYSWVGGWLGRAAVLLSFFWIYGGFWLHELGLGLVI